MSEFWWGVLSLPIIVAACAGAYAAVIAVWVLAEKVSKRVFGKMPAVEMPGEGGARYYASGQMGVRGRMAAMLIAGCKGRYLIIGPLVLTAGWGAVDRFKVNIAQSALTNAWEEAATKYKEHADA